MSVHNRDVPRSFIDKVTKRLLRHFPGPNNQDLFFLESLKEPTCKITHRDTGDADSLAVNCRLRRNTFGHAIGGLEYRMHRWTSRFSRERPFVRLLHLCQNLWLAYHHTVHAGSHGEQMVDRCTGIVDK